MPIRESLGDTSIEAGLAAGAPPASAGSPRRAATLRQLLLHTTRYSLANLLNALGSLVSFPLLTRLLSVEHYGQLNLVAATLSVLEAFGKAGIQHSAGALHAEVEARRRAEGIRDFHSTLLIGMTAVAVLVTLAWLALVGFLPTEILGDGRLRELMRLSAALIVVRVVESAFSAVLRVSERSAALAGYTVIKRYFTLAAVIAALLLIRPDPIAFFAATLAAEALTTLAFGIWMTRRGGLEARLQHACWSTPLFRDMLAFGLPLVVGYEIAGSILNVGDRYVIQALLGSGAVGLYSAAYNLCLSVKAVAMASLGQAIVPMYMKLWHEKGREETERFLNRSLEYYLMLGVPACVGVWSIGRELLALLASARYLPAASVVPWVMLGMLADGASMIWGAGLYVERRTLAVAGLLSSATLANIALNFVLVPRLGIDGAAVATLISYAALAAALVAAGWRCLRVRVAWGRVARWVAAAGVMYLGVAGLGDGPPLRALVLKVVSGTAIYLSVLPLLDPPARGLYRVLAAALAERVPAFKGRG